MGATRTGRAAVTGVIVLCSGMGPDAARAQTWAGWTFYWENDAFVFGRGTDDLYTNGLRVALARDPECNFALAKALGRWWTRHWPLSRRRPDDITTSAVILGQNFFTPTEITDYEVDPADRPYAGLLYAGMRVDITENAPEHPTEWQLRFQHSIEAAGGVLGPAAGAGEVQADLHVLRKNRIPKGWRHQLPNEPALFVNYNWRARFGVHFADLVPHVGLMLGTPQTYGYAGAVARIGWNMSGFPAQLLRPTVNATQKRKAPGAEREPWEFGAFVGGERRAFARNAFVEGNLFGDSPRVPSERRVGDRLWGVTLRLTDWRLTYTKVLRTPEIAGDGQFGNLSHRFGSFALAYEPGQSAPPTWWDRLLKKIGVGPLVEATIGRGMLVGDDAGADGLGDGRAMHFAAGLRFRRHFEAAYEMTGMVLESGPPKTPGGDHTDTFLVGQLYTLRAVPFGLGQGSGPGPLHVRAGVGRGTEKFQVTPGEPGQRPGGVCPEGTTLHEEGRFCNRSETGRSFVLGAGYGYRLSSSALVGLDLAWNRIRLTRPRTFVTATAGVVLRP